MTTAGGGSEGISWVDVAASASGILNQMQQIGQQAKGGFIQGFNSGLGPELTRSATTAGAEYGRAFSAAMNAQTRVASAQLSTSMQTEMASSNVAGAAKASGGAVGGALSEGMVSGFAAAGGVAAIGALVVRDVRDFKRLVTGEFEAIGRLGRDAAANLMGDFESVMAGKVPSIEQTFGLLSEGLRTSVEGPLKAAQMVITDTADMVPILGKVTREAFSEMDSALGGALDDATTFGNRFTQVMLDVGDSWQTVARQLAGETLDPGQAEASLGVIRDLAASGTVANLGNLAAAVGTLGQRLAGLGEGAGLTTGQLEELARTLNLGDELLGVKINVDNLTAAFNDFNIAPERAAEELTTFVNIARATGAPINTLLTAVDQLGPALQEMGYTLDETAFFAGRLNQEFGPVASGRMVSSLVNMDEKLRKNGQTLGDVIELVKAYHAAGEDAASVEMFKSLGVQGRSALTLVKAISEGLLDTPEKLRQAMDAAGPALRTPLEDAVDATRTLGDTVDELSNQMKEAFADIGLPLVQGLNRAGDHLKEWLQEHKSEVIGWGAEVIDAIGRTVAVALVDIGQLLVDVAPFVDMFAKFVIGNLKAVDLAMQAVLAPLSLLPDWAGGDVFKDAFKDLRQAIPTFDALLTTDFAPSLAKAGEGLQGLGHQLGGAMDGLDQYMSKARDAASISEALQDKFATKAGDKPTIQQAFGADDQGLKLLPGADWEGIRGALSNLGIGIDFDQQSGRIKSFTAKTQAEADALMNYLKSRFSPKEWEALAPKIPVTVVPAPPLSEGETRAKLGLPSEIGVPIVPQAPSGPAPAPGAPFIHVGGGPQGFDWGPSGLGPVERQPAGPAPAPGPAGGYTIPGETPVPRHTDPNDPQNIPGAAYSGGLVIAVPSSLTVRDPSQRKTLAQVMEAIGIPDSLQSSDGVVLPTSFDMTNSPPLSMPVGYGAPGGLPDMGGVPGGGSSPVLPGGPRFQNVNWAAIAGAESGGNWAIDHGEGTPDNPVTGGLQIGDKTWADFGGTRYAPRAYMATPEQQIEIAEKILASQGPHAWPVTSAQHPEWFGGGGTPGGDGGGAPGGDFGTGAGNPTIAPPDENTIRSWVQANFGIPNTFGTGSWENRSHEYDGGWHHRGLGGATVPSGYAFDFHGSPEQMDALANWIAQHWAKDTLELIHQGPGFDTSREIKNGRFGDVYGPALDAEHRDHVHWAVTLPPYQLAGFNLPQTGGAGGVSLADWHTSTGSGGNNVFGADWGQPGGSGTGPPPGVQPVPPGTPDAVHTPYGDFTYSWKPNSPWAGLPEAERRKYDQWLKQQETRQQQTGDTDAEIGRAQQELDAARAKKDEADNELARLNAEIAKLPADKQDLARAQDNYQKALAKASEADRRYAAAQQSVARAKERQHDQDTQQHIDAETPPPWASTKGSGRVDSNAESLGKGLVKGIFQELGFPDVFGKPPTEWGIWKLAMGGLGYGLGVANQIGDAKYPGATGGSGWGGAGGAGGQSGGMASTIGGLINGLPGGNLIMHPTRAAFHPPGIDRGGPSGPGGAPQPAAAVSMAPSSGPAAVPVGAQTGVQGSPFSSLTVNYNPQGVNVLTQPQVQQGITDALHTTSAPAMSGGGGVPT